MILSLVDIKKIISADFSGIRFLEGDSKTTGRYKDKDIILFEYTDGQGRAAVLKFFSLQKMEEHQKQEQMQDLMAEYHTIRRFDGHPNVVRVHGASELRHQDRLVGFYMTMEKFERTLSDLIRERGRFGDGEVENFLGQMDRVLYHAHYELPEPVVHSDIKPANIGVRSNGQALEYALMDFDVSVGLERSGEDTASFTLSNKASMKGLSPAYAPPEQVLAYLHKSGTISNRVDIYAVGAIAMEMITGTPPQKDDAQVYYKLPFEQLPEVWRGRLKALCHPDSRSRVRRVAEAAEKQQDIENGGNETDDKTQRWVHPEDDQTVKTADSPSGSSQQVLDNVYYKSLLEVSGKQFRCRKCGRSLVEAEIKGIYHCQPCKAYEKVVVKNNSHWLEDVTKAVEIYSFIKKQPNNLHSIIKTNKVLINRAARLSLQQISFIVTPIIILLMVWFHFEGTYLRDLYYAREYSGVTTLLSSTVLVYIFSHLYLILPLCLYCIALVYFMKLRRKKKTDLIRSNSKLREVVKLYEKALEDITDKLESYEIEKTEQVVVEYMYSIKDKLAYKYINDKQKRNVETLLIRHKQSLSHF